MVRQMTTIDKSVIEKVNNFQWYQTIPLGEGFSTPGETGDAEQRKIEMMKLPDDLSGKTILDIGCNEGFFSFDVEKRKAKKILAIDKSSVAMEKFNLIKSIFNSKVEFQKKEILELNPSEIGKFDIVFFLSVFHHLRYPFMVLDRIYELTRGYALMEFVEAIPERDEHLSALVRKMSKRGHLHILPTRTFILEILNRAGFSNIEILESHRRHQIKPTRKMPGFNEQRVLLKACR